MCVAHELRLSMNTCLSPACLGGEQASVWDVDGTGMQFIEDPDVDLGIRKARA